MTQSRHPRPRTLLSRDAGSASLELVLLAPVLVLGLLLVVWCGRLAEARGAVTLAAGQAARAGSMAAHARMVPVAQAAARATLRLNDSPCAALGVSADVQVSSEPGGSAVSVTVGCTSRVDGLGPFASRHATARARSPIDHYRVT
jgi:hypothetical protein